MKMWQDNEIRFDIAKRYLKQRAGEHLIDKMDFIEDTKGNVGEQGRLMITNLRVIWHCISLSRINLSVGYNTFVSVATKVIETAHNGVTQSLMLMCSFRNAKYEFIFTNLDNKSTRHYTSVTGVYRAYVSSKIYREIKLRGGIIQHKRLSLLPNENVHTNLPGVWNLSTEQGNIGTFIVTNIRLVWYADMNHNFNVSLPYIAVASINIKSSKFGPTLVILSNEANGAYILGFRVDPVQKLHSLHKEITALYAAFCKDPIYGVEYTFEHQTPTEPETSEEGISQDNNIDDEGEADENEISNVLSIYVTQSNVNNRKPVYSNYLGLAVEEPREGTDLQQLWELLPST